MLSWSAVRLCFPAVPGTRIDEGQRCRFAEVYLHLMSCQEPSEKHGDRCIVGRGAVRMRTQSHHAVRQSLCWAELLVNGCSAGAVFISRCRLWGFLFCVPSLLIMLCAQYNRCVSVSCFLSGSCENSAYFYWACKGAVHWYCENSMTASITFIRYVFLSITLKMKIR